MKPNEVYETIKDLSLPFIENYHEDLLVHDKKAIEENTENIPFLHFTGTNGTWMFDLLPSNKYPAKGESIRYLFGYADRKHMLHETLKCVKHCRNSNRQSLILYFDGIRISKINQDVADSLVEDYVSKIEAEWKAENLD
jgi:hypothetical protein